MHLQGQRGGHKNEQESKASHFPFHFSSKPPSPQHPCPLSRLVLQDTGRLENFLLMGESTSISTVVSVAHVAWMRRTPMSWFQAGVPLVVRWCDHNCESKLCYASRRRLPEPAWRNVARCKWANAGQLVSSWSTGRPPGLIFYSAFRPSLS